MNLQLHGYPDHRKLRVLHSDHPAFEIGDEVDDRDLGLHPDGRGLSRQMRLTSTRAPEVSITMTQPDTLNLDTTTIVPEPPSLIWTVLELA